MLHVAEAKRVKVMTVPLVAVKRAQEVVVEVVKRAQEVVVEVVVELMKRAQVVVEVMKRAQATAPPCP